MSAAPSVAQGRAGGSDRAVVLALLAPGLLALGVTFLLPMVWLLRQSFSMPGYGVGHGGVWTLESYIEVFTDPFYWKVGWNTLKLGAVVAIGAVILSFPIALFLARTTSRWRGLLTALAIAPLLTSSVVRTYGWMIILGEQGLVNTALKSLGLIERSLMLAYNFNGAALALIQILMPYSILAMLSGFGRLNRQLEDAAALLGANRFTVFRRIILPLAMPGILNGALLVFVLAISSFVTPRLMGGGRLFVLGTEVYSEAVITFNWALASALSIVLLLLFTLVILIYRRIFAATLQ